MMNYAQNSTDNSKRVVGRPFQPGESGNPGGRPTMTPEVREILRAATVDAAKLLVDTINDETAQLSLRIKCAEVVFDRVYGRPQQAVEVDSTTIPQVIFVGWDQIAD